MRRFIRSRKVDSRHLAATFVGAFGLSGAAIATGGQLKEILLFYFFGSILTGVLGLLTLRKWADTKYPSTYGAAIIATAALVPLTLGIIIRVSG